MKFSALLLAVPCWQNRRKSYLLTVCIADCGIKKRIRRAGGGYAFYLKGKYPNETSR